MLDRIVTAIVLALLTWLERRIERSGQAAEADRHADALRRIGDRIREWERLQQARADPRRQSDPHRS